MFRISHAIVIDTSIMLNFRMISSTIYTTLNIYDRSLLYEYWSFACPGEVLVAVILCLAYSDP